MNTIIAHPLYQYRDFNKHLSVNDYNSGGMVMPGRNFSSENYRFGFNGKENDNEVHEVAGGWQDYGMRMYDPRICRFPSVDPLDSKYPWYTPYQFAGNNPIKFIDLDGLEPAEKGTPGQYAIAEKQGTSQTYGYTWKVVDQDTGKEDWVQGKSTFYSAGNVRDNERDGIADEDMTRENYPDQQVKSICFDSENCHLTSFTAAYMAGIGLESAENKTEAMLLYGNFLFGYKNVLRFGNHSGMASLLSKDGSFVEIASAFEKAALEHYKSKGNLEEFDGGDVLGSFGIAYINDTYFMHTVMGGTKEFDAQIKMISATEAKVSYTVWDHFGADRKDAVKYWIPGLPNLFWLQHNSGYTDKYIPFIWNIQVNR